ncbi:tumor necrosis factor receptor superfamily member 5 [Hoplias malabaricus]|uniref:tumor necrosis factor receptor superfamily member 5 n=1 Tax=Hoplias malabaricus TaxID=27720 RepID=UPI003461EB99
MKLLFIFLLVLPVLVHSCSDTEYVKDGSCCKKCGPGKRMKQNTDCIDPTCEECGDGEYQDGYTEKTQCQRQPICDPNLNFVVDPKPSKIKRSECQCLPGHYCSSQPCVTCVKHTVCEAGYKVKKMGDQNSDTECEPCSNGTFSSEESAISCTSWTKCQTGYAESKPGTLTSDRICNYQYRVHMGIGISIVVLAAVCICIYGFKKGRTKSFCLQKKLQSHCPGWCFHINNVPIPLEEKMTPEAEQEQTLIDIPNEERLHSDPQEDNEDTTKLDDHFKRGLSANGMPVDQDHSKTSIVSQLETEQTSAHSYSDQL